MKSLAKSFLETGNVDVEAKYLSREGVLRGQVFGTPDTLLPGILGHRAIMGLRLAPSNCVGSRASYRDTPFLRLTAAKGRDYIPLQV